MPQDYLDGLDPGRARRPLAGQGLGRQLMTATLANLAAAGYREAGAVGPAGQRSGAAVLLPGRLGRGRYRRPLRQPRHAARMTPSARHVSAGDHVINRGGTRRATLELRY